MNLKKMLLRYFCALSVFALVTTDGLSQKDCDKVNTIQFSVMVLPRTVQGEDLRTIMDEQPEIRVAISKVKERFDRRGFTTLDFETYLKALIRDETATKDNQTEFKNRVFRNIGSDIIVELDIIPDNHSSGNLVRVILEGNVTDNGQSLASLTCESNRFRTTDTTALIGSALRKGVKDEENNSTECIEVFLDTVDEKWKAMWDVGKSVKMEFSLSDDAGIGMDDEVPGQGEKLKYLIEDWLEETSFGNYYVVTVVTATKLLVEDYRYPVRDPKNCTNMTPRKIERKLDRFFDKIDVPVKFDNSRGTIYITIL